VTKTALIVGAGSGISASFGRYWPRMATGSRRPPETPQSFTRLPAETKATTYPCDAADPPSVDQPFAHIDQPFPKLGVCLFSASARAPGPITDVDREQPQTALLVSAYGGSLLAQAAAQASASRACKRSRCSSQDMCNKNLRTVVPFSISVLLKR